MNHDGLEYLIITNIIFGKKQILEQLISLSCGLFQTIIRPIESHAIMNLNFNNSKRLYFGMNDLVIQDLLDAPHS